MPSRFYIWHLEDMNKLLKQKGVNMIELNLLSIWIPIIVSVVLLIWGIFSNDNGDFGGLFTLPFSIFGILLIWVIWFILKEIF
jgi:hypothetical protein